MTIRGVRAPMPHITLAVFKYITINLVRLYPMKCKGGIKARRLIATHSLTDTALNFSGSCDLQAITRADGMQ
jgi:hypothetical protein